MMEHPNENNQEPIEKAGRIGEEKASPAASFSNPLAIHAPGKKSGLINPVVLAYMGDAVFELLVRQYLISLPNNKSHHLHQEATKRVSAKAQRLQLERLQPLLTEEEADMVRRGRNTKSGAPPKNADPADYRQATALECLFGYLYFEGRMERIGELMRVALGEDE
ncbi:Mini-ribonuclease 3 [Paenibacillus sp. PAMC21692]|uniref:Mini-ribonuclease 3 n=1 Tax=Paenibacillus sp. PAMC21692 TaxID=2762320 RepID=UPI0037CB24B1